MPKILIVEDGDLNMAVHSRMLEEGGYLDYMCAATAAEAELLIGENNFDIVLLDILLGEKYSGYELAEYIRKNEKKKTCIIVITGIENYEPIPSADGLIRKPVKTEDLLSAIEICGIQK